MVQNIQYFIGYNNDDVIRPLCIKLPQMIGYVKHFARGKKTMSFKDIDNKLLKKYNKIIPNSFRRLNLINDDFGPSSSDESDSKSDNGSGNESDNRFDNESDNCFFPSFIL